MYDGGEMSFTSIDCIHRFVVTLTSRVLLGASKYELPNSVKYTQSIAIN
jgi:hypothetical protein